MFTTAPELRPYSALSVELSTLNSDTVLIDGWNVIWFWTWSFRLIPLTMKFTVSSRLPAVLKAKEPWPRRGAVRKPVAGWGATEPGDEEAEVHEVAAVEGDLLHRPLVDDLAHRRGGGLDHRSFRHDAQLLGHAAHAQLDVLDGDLGHLEPDVLHRLGLELVELRLQPVEARGRGRESGSPRPCRRRRCSLPPSPGYER